MKYSIMDIEIYNKPEQEIQESLTTQKCANSYMRLQIYTCINALYKKGTLPTIDDVYEHLKNMISLTLPEFKETMADMGYITKKMPFGNLLLEKPENTLERFHYLKNILKLRLKKNQHIYYLDHRLIDTTLNFPKLSLHVNDSFHSLDDSVIFLYAISALTGEVIGIFQNTFDSTTFTKWISDIVAISLPPKSVIVVDNEFKSIVSKREMTMYDTKDDILMWLRANNVPCSNEMRKPELFELHKLSFNKYSKCDFDKTFERSGHQVLTLPSHLSELCPTNFLWGEIKKLLLEPKDPNSHMRIKRKGISYLISEITALTMPLIVNNLSGFDLTVKYLENQMFKIDADTEKSLDNLIQHCKKNTGLKNT